MQILSNPGNYSQKFQIGKLIQSYLKKEETTENILIIRMIEINVKITSNNNKTLS